MVPCVSASLFLSLGALAFSRPTSNVRHDTPTIAESADDGQSVHAEWQPWTEEDSTNYHDLKPLENIIRELMDDDISEKANLPEFGWAKILVEKWKRTKIEFSGQIPNEADRLGYIVDRLEPLADMCDTTRRPTYIGYPYAWSDHCMRNLIGGLMIIIESAIDNDGGKPLEPALLLNSRAGKPNRIGQIIDKIGDALNEKSYSPKDVSHESHEELPSVRLFGIGNNAPVQGSVQPSSGSGIINRLKDPLIQSVLGAVSGMAFSDEPSSKTMIGGMVGRVADIVTFPILGERGSKAARGGIQGVADTVVGGLTNVLFG